MKRLLLATGLLGLSLAAQAGRYELVIDEGQVRFSDGARPALTVNGQSPAPELRAQEIPDPDPFFGIRLAKDARTDLILSQPCACNGKTLTWKTTF